jgi:hypothetical protein
MAGWADVRRIALALPEATERPMHGTASWRVRDKLFVWERPLRRFDLEALIVEAWLVRAPARLARDYLDSHSS